MRRSLRRVDRLKAMASLRRQRLGWEPRDREIAGVAEEIGANLGRRGVIVPRAAGAWWFGSVGHLSDQHLRCSVLVAQTEIRMINSPNR